jgi:hypothetical protein
MHPAAEWSDFLVAAAGAAAALAGLVFVGISINLTKIVSSPAISNRASEALMILLGVLVTSLVALAPNQPEKILGTEFLVVDGILWVLIVTWQGRAHRIGLVVPWRFFLMRVVVFQLAILPFLLAGLSLLVGWPGAMYWLVPGCIFSFLAGMQGAWVILIEIMR